MGQREAVSVDLVREDLVIHFGDGRTALVTLRDIYDLAVEKNAFVENPIEEENGANE